MSREMSERIIDTSPGKIRPDFDDFESISHQGINPPPQAMRNPQYSKTNSYFELPA
jgi:hypothetical protein